MSGGPPPGNEYVGYVDPDIPPPGGENDADVIIYGYIPATSLGILAIILFVIALILHLWRLIKYRTWYFVPFIVGTAMEVVGFTARLLAAERNPYSVIYFVIQYFFIVVAPVLFSATIYTILTVFINRTKREYSPLPPKLILWIFITCDAIATITQVTGAALIGVAASSDEDPTTPNNILLAGLAFQVTAFFTFCVFFGIFIFRARKIILSSLKAFTIAVCIATLCVYLRTCFRLAETAEGLQSEIGSQEVYFGVLEFAPVVIAVYVLAIWYPGKWLPRNKQLTVSA